ncbi:ribonuclease P protein component [Daejeonella sp.]|jgi:ribonuclease P protein component|uniref:ribonuclease P protein component n=1 Tax=Daejeonella sp. TaxID=2805397 RepID=UPI0037BF77E3
MNSFNKEERLCNVKLIDKLYHNGSSFLVYPFRIIWLAADSDLPFPAQILISIPKKRFKKAVDRNLLKRRIREIYRLNKSEMLYPFLNQRSEKIILAINYIGNEISEYASLEKKFISAIQRLKKNISEPVC